MKELEAPPAYPVDWRVMAGERGVIIQARTWFEARENGARVLGVDRYTVTCRRAT